MASDMEPRRTTSSVTKSSERSFFHRALTWRAQDQGNREPGKGPIGLTTVYDPGLGEATIVDLVFVHGLNGGSYSTWSKDNQRSHFWPREWLPLDDAFRDIRIHTFGYPSGLSRESILDIQDFAGSLLAAVSDSPVINQGSTTKLIFVAHSMGGLVVKKAFILAHEETEFKPLVDRISAIFFLATPHHGATIAQTLLRFMAPVPGARPFVDDLLPESTMLQSINEAFPRLCSDVKLLSFFESKATNFGIKDILIVEKTSAVMNLTNERKTLLDADHRGAAKYSSRKDPSYLVVRNALAKAISAARSAAHSLLQFMIHEDQAALDNFLSISESPGDVIITQDTVRFPGSCQWILSNVHYRSWTDASNCSILWLLGRPGAGKSVLAGNIINDLRAKGVDTCFYFFQSDDASHSTANGCLRSMAWQMAMIHRDVAANVKQLLRKSKDGPIDKIDPALAWRKLYMSGILNVQLERPQFWVIDAMDQCRESRDMMDFLVRIQEHWPVSVLVTCRNPVEVHLGNAKPRGNLRSYTITEEDTTKDISMFLKSNMPHLPCLGGSKWSNSSEMVSEIVKNSEGSFLWASLICSELREVTSQGEAEKVLESVPSDMDSLYSKILLNMENMRFGKELAKAIILWTTYAFRPMATVEVQEAIELDLGDKIDTVERAIPKCCGSMVYTDSHGKIQFIHSTAREFLINNKGESDFTVSSTEGHRRLALVCLRYLMQMNESLSTRRRAGLDSRVKAVRSPSTGPSASRLLRPAPGHTVQDTHDTSVPGASSPSPFTAYAALYLFSHLKEMDTMDEEVLIMLAKFFGNTSVLRWIEVVAAIGDLRTVYQAGLLINSMLGRRAKGCSESQEPLEKLQRWSGDLMYLVAKFSHRLRSSPKSVHHVIPPFSPAKSAIRQQFGSSHRGLSVQGLLAGDWDDCLTTITFGQGLKPVKIAAGPGHFAIALMGSAGKIVMYDDSVFQEIYDMLHCEPVRCLAFAASGKLLASAGSKTVRIWSCIEGIELANFAIPSRCLALCFTDEDSVLKVATGQNQLVEWDLEQQDFLQEPITWDTDLDERIQFRTPVMAAFRSVEDVLCVVYKGEDLILWDYGNDRIYDVYEKNAESLLIYNDRRCTGRATDVRALAVSQGSDNNLLAATYIDGDLVVYDLDQGHPVATLQGANTMLLASSHDGHILAGAESYGILTLFEFETLHPLSRIYLGPRGLPKDLTFLSDNHRFLEISGNQCRVWAAKAALLTDASVEEDIDTSFVPTELSGIGFRPGSGTNITAMASCKTSNTVFCGLEDGSVHAYDISGEPRSHILFVQSPRYFINLLYLDETQSILACGDITGRVTVRKVARPAASGQTSWDALDKPIFDTGRQDLLVLKTIVVSGQQGRLLICTSKHDTLWPLGPYKEQGWITQVEANREIRVVHNHIQNDDSSYWLPHPTQTELLVRITDTDISLYRWSDLSLVRSVQISLDGSLHRVIKLDHHQYIATISGIHSASDNTMKYCVCIWDMKDFDTVTDVMACIRLTNDVSSNAHGVIGVFGVRLVFCTADYWVASVELTPASANDDTFVRHFFIPEDWLGTTTPTNSAGFAMGRNGEVLFGKGSELAVIKRGLEAMEDGTIFNPRRASAFVQDVKGSPSRQARPNRRMASESRAILAHR